MCTVVSGAAYACMAMCCIQHAATEKSIFVLKQPLLLQGGYGALEMSHSFLSDSYQIPIRSFQIQWGAFLSDSSMQFNSKRCQPASYQLPIRFLSEKILILQRNIDSKPAHHQGCSANFLIFVLKQSLLLQGSFQTLNRFQSHTYQFPSRIPKFNFGAKTTPSYHGGLLRTGSFKPAV